MVQKSTNLGTLQIIATVTGSNYVCLMLNNNTEFIPVGRYCESLKPLQKFDPAKYRLIEGESDETGKPYKVIADELTYKTFKNPFTDSKDELKSQIKSLKRDLAESEHANDRLAKALEIAHAKVAAFNKFKELLNS